MDTYESQSVRIGLTPDVFPQGPARHKIRDERELNGSGRDTPEAQYVWVSHTFPYHGPLMEDL